MIMRVMFYVGSNVDDVADDAAYKYWLVCNRPMDETIQTHIDGLKGARESGCKSLKLAFYCYGHGPAIVTLPTPDPSYEQWVGILPKVQEEWNRVQDE